jgi:hypothetical protein
VFLAVGGVGFLFWLLFSGFLEKGEYKRNFGGCIQ